MPADHFGASGGPLLEALWQGRLIPGARIESLPFIEAVRCRRSAAARDALPDAVFRRIWGCAFFGPRFLVTRNKLTFRDNLQELLAKATPGATLQQNNIIPYLRGF
jgi:structural maintenance of chromosomes flexible hinge domain-containing protein 1